jgi:BirA family biotin operon repressor/biotin-[acetyl-CoA-carboxylase] ligase
LPELSANETTAPPEVLATLEKLLHQPDGIESSVSPEAIHYLEGHGCRFRKKNTSIQLISSGLPVWRDYLQTQLGQGWTIQVFASTQSTQDIALKSAQTGQVMKQSTLIVAGEQTAGRGRFGRPWHAAANQSLTFSMVMPLPPNKYGTATFAMAAPLAIAQCIEDRLGQQNERVSIKWPNDVYLDSRKVAGVLINIVEHHAIIGIGINVAQEATDFPPELRSIATSLAMAGVNQDRLAVLADVVTQASKLVNETDPKKLFNLWRERCLRHPLDVRLKKDSDTHTGRLVDIDHDLQLTLQTADSRRLTFDGRNTLAEV